MKCQTCEKEFIPKNRYGKNLFCSNKCKIEARSTDPIERLWKGVKKTNFCWAWEGASNSFGHGQMSIKGKKVYVHRLSYEIYFGNIPDGFYVCHTCDNPACVKPTHLYIGTIKDNVSDCHKKGRFKPLLGSKNPKTKLSKDHVEEIRCLYESSSISQIQLARKYGVSQTAVSAILRNKTWITNQNSIPDNKHLSQQS